MEIGTRERNINDKARTYSCLLASSLTVTHLAELQWVACIELEKNFTAYPLESDYK